MRLFFKTIILLATFFGFTLRQASAQQSLSEYKFHVCSPEGGFYYDGVKSVKQDSSGFIWVLMDDDLYRYDGYEHLSYYRYFQSMNFTEKWIFNDIETDTLGKLYVVANNKLYVHHAKTNRFDCLLNTTTSFLKIDKQNHIWLKIPYLNLYEPESGTLIPVTYNGKPVADISFFWNKGNQTYAASTRGIIYQINIKSGQCIQCGALPSDYYLKMDVKGKTIWACSSKNKLYRIDSESYKPIKIYDFFDTPDNSVGALYIDKFQKVWIGTRRGLYVLDSQTGEHVQFHSRRDYPFSIPDNSIWTINEDREQNIWIGTYSGGLCYFNPKEKNYFESFSPKETAISHPIISGFTETDQELWIASEGGGITIFNKKTGAFSYQKYEPHKNSLAYDNVKTMVTDSIRKNIWISMFQGGLDCYHIPTRTFTHYKNDPQNENSLRVNDLRKIVLESDSGLWIAYQSTKLLLSYYSFKNHSFEHFSMNNLHGDNFVFDICRDKTSNDLWIVTHRKVYCLNVKDKKLKEIPSPDMINGQSLYVDSNHNVWIGTIGKGLVKYSVKDSTYRSYNELLKFKVSTIYSICPDRYGCLWLGTDNGLFHFNPQTGFFMQFTKEDGVQGRVFYPLAAMQSASGKLFFGGTNGFTIVTNADIQVNTQKPKAMISNILINTISILFDSTLNIRMDKELTLKHDNSNIGFQFSSDNYLMPAKNRFKYRLAGYDDQWVETDASNRYAYFTKLPAGNYTFELMASNNDGLWGDTPLQMKIRCLPAPWLSAWAYALYGLIASLTLFVLSWYYYRHRQLKIALYKENMENQKREEIHQSQLSFFTNISHEFKTPLSLILAVTDTLRKEGIREYYFRILNNNAQRLHQLVNELMLFRTVESGKQSLHLERIDINAFVKNIAEDFLDLAEQHHFHFTIQPDEALPENPPADRMILEKIIINLLNNAFRYTPDRGSISIGIYSDIHSYIPSYPNSYHTGNEQVDNPFYIVVHDTGVGISESSIHKIFDRYYKVDSTLNNHLGSGIGLALVKSLVMLHKGSITVYSEREKGAEMVVALSKNTETYNVQDFTVELHPVEYKYLQSPIEQMEEISVQPAEISETDKLYLRENKRILIAEDNEDLRKLVASFLSSYYEVVEASNGITAADLIRDMEINLIISDIMMPLKDGITLCQETKTDINSSHIPFIMFTAKTGQESELEGLESGADVYLEKPVNFDLLLQVVRNIFKQQDSLKEYYAKHYFIEPSEVTANRQYNTFLKKLYELLEANIDNSELDVTYIASELSMSKSKLYAKLKSITGKSLVEIMLNYRLRKAARLMIEEELTIGEIIMHVGIESQSYFTRMFKKEFGETPTAFIAKRNTKKNNRYRYTKRER